MAAPKTVIFLGDGMADEPVPVLDGKTPLQAASTPAMDSIAREGCCGTLLTLPAGFPTSSDVANMSVLGCDLASEYCGRGPLEAAGRGLSLRPGDTVFRVNLTTVDNGVLKDYAAGHIAQQDADELVAVLNRRFGGPQVRFHAGVSYRSLLILSGPGFSPAVHTDKPDDHQHEPLSDHMPRAEAPGGEATAALLRRLMTEAGPLLESAPANRRRIAEGRPPANGVWPWSGGRSGAMRSLADRYGIAGAVISAVDVIAGLGRSLGMDVIEVPGATGYVDTNYEGKADAAVEALKTHDLVYLHVEAIDEISHKQDARRKVTVIEDFDTRVVARVLSATGRRINAAVLPDHPVPVTHGKHTRTPVPVAVRMAGRPPDTVQVYDETSCRSGSLGAMTDGDLMRLLFGRPAC